MTNRYPIPAETTRVEYVVVNSRFISTIGEARTDTGARAFIDAVKAEFSDAAHNVYAFRSGYGASVTEGMSDDGEPAGTAGRPALAVLRGADLGDVVVVITRYFGGTKLGTGGLVRAYTQGVQEALAALPRAERVTWMRGLVAVPYHLYERVHDLVKPHGGLIDAQDFAVDVTLTLRFPEGDSGAFEDALRELSSGACEVLWE